MKLEHHYRMVAKTVLTQTGIAGMMNERYLQLYFSCSRNVLITINFPIVSVCNYFHELTESVIKNVEGTLAHCPVFFSKLRLFITGNLMVEFTMFWL